MIIRYLDPLGNNGYSVQRLGVRNSAVGSRRPDTRFRFELLGFRGVPKLTVA